MTRGEYMRKARMDAGLSIVRLAEISGIAQTTISLLERKSLRGGWIDTIEILADALGLSIDEYVGHERVVRNERGGMNDADNKTVSHTGGKGVR